MENGYRPECLHLEVDKLPEGINHLFHHFMTSISHGARRKAYQTLDTIVRANEWYFKITLLAWKLFEGCGSFEEEAEQLSQRASRSYNHRER
ncbi:hypothetical protein BDP55DRAFT_687500 [Colletotrichum godetiae]|uniref:Uncharacterized protein n=1 Tax=Colletotrichum godetiae TaxID=1209918 RepID=A0AAJ0A8E7_9PEZI|nr:uncharacterized protein BDP55DRAFT_687500 [Colletotrichum godetiae]KAK1656917.1 hypothetical protein BDP55DRAFT_687500 [Colletotrichum godetiae]